MVMLLLLPSAPMAASLAHDPGVDPGLAQQGQHAVGYV